MTLTERHFLKVVLEIHDQLARQPANASIWLPASRWQQLQREHRLHSKAQRRGWTHTAARMRQRMQMSLQSLLRDLQFNAHSLDVPGSQQHASAPEIFGDLRALADEFASIEVDFENREIVVVTAEIVLQGIELGRFEIRLPFENYPDKASCYRVVALDPHPAASNRHVPHPHVQDETLCEGTGRASIQLALQQGRLFDFFTIVAGILATYNEGSPYVSLEDWRSVHCVDCGSLVREDCEVLCESCRDTLCENCSIRCGDCDHEFCCGCTSECDGCNERVCHHCLSACADCEADFCSSCLCAERCDHCHENQPDCETESPSPTSSPAV
ncbi:hypothetical protein [Rubinisphaera brasiliensis]|uniref:Uncharacterized protein n=1 Tax=Rubinisphaera brasiliensis (strain ATCC 49424 / DSM 5305 / JCM 21570 / IAM 15109 / NBRC 103401 / IFAM 1448) TaxID=756272 RepID=F0SR67_RUBBR|nr:hypothetical protein [Rubinisphaera brasiliensis]ADY61314.1 hypothetical protein Plabr_3724 [Rubinisphaera brasiliensis DSM 5305]